MHVIITESYSNSCRIAADMIAEVVRNKPDAVLGLATGSTAGDVYPYLIQYYREGQLDFSNVSSINLDEYVGLEPEHPQSYRFFMDHKLFGSININKENTYIVSGLGNLDKRVEEFNEKIEKLCVDIQLLGIGVNGHIGFNEPGPVLHSQAHMEVLQDSTIKANARFFHNMTEVPRRAISMGLGGIMRARKIVLVATGLTKAAAISSLINNDEISTEIPATMIKLHPDATVIIDHDLAERTKVL